MAAQGNAKTVAYKKQSAQGTAASGSGGQYLRTRTATFNLTRDTYENDERTSHRQSTGATAGIRRATGKIAGLWSPGTYADFLASLVKKAFASTTTIALGATTLAVAVNTGVVTLTRSAGSWLTDGVKIGHVFRLTGAGLNADAINKNMVVLSATPTVLTARVVNGSTVTASAASASASVSFPGKKADAAITSHLDEWYTFEEFYGDLTPTRSELWPDSRIQQAAIGISATGNVTIDFDVIPLNRVRGASQVLTTPASETTASPVASINLFLMVGSTLTPVTGLQLTINSGDTPGEAETGSNGISDVAKGILAVSGQFMAKFNHTTFQDAFDDQTPVALFGVVAVDGTANADFVTFVLPRVKLFGDSSDDGRAKEIIRTYPFTAEIPATGGAGVSNERAIISIQDSLA